MTINSSSKRIGHTVARAVERGLTLVEIMIVLIILGVVMTWLVGKVVGAGDKAKFQLTQAKIKDLAGQIEQFYLQYNSLPSSLDDLTKCTEKTGPNCVPVISKDDILIDSWGERFVYSLEEGGRRYKIKSMGADRKDGGEGVYGDPFGTGP